jgi:hypothetical protein
MFHIVAERKKEYKWEFTGLWEILKNTLIFTSGYKKRRKSLCTIILPERPVFSEPGGGEAPSRALRKYETFPCCLRQDVL